MKQLFTAVTLATGLAVASGAQAETKTLGCETDNGQRAFTLTYDTDTNLATFEGEITVPSLSHEYEFGPVIHIVDDPVYHDMVLRIQRASGNNAGGAMIATLPVRETFEMSAKSYVKVMIDGDNINGFTAVTCPVPTRAMALD